MAVSEAELRKAVERYLKRKAYMRERWEKIKKDPDLKAKVYEYQRARRMREKALLEEARRRGLLKE